MSGFHNSMNRVIITHGPGFEPIDEARRITNFSTGHLGTKLAESFASSGFPVIALRGVLATYPMASYPVETIPFTTNGNLIQKLKEIGDPDAVGWVFHLAALCDFAVSQILDDAGTPLNQAKIPTRNGGITLRLEPSIKVLPHLPHMFPKAQVVGWKYELNGAKADALQAAHQQIQGIQSAACVVNGSAYGPGFGFVLPDGNYQHLPDADALADWLVSWCTNHHNNRN